MIVAIDGTRVQNVDELLTEVEAHAPGDVVKVTVLRGGKLVDVPVKLGAVVSGTRRRERLLVSSHTHRTGAEMGSLGESADDPRYRSST